ncbi:hypothetical protein [Parasphingopyxis sp.]|uniref:hypothetical protein n=1 Tax=Parasphingopyxis sp. TaxID=1920299 RepID=UPI002616E807|nr:hypothetical protein [Parasphingopyxis sp.]
MTRLLAVTALIGAMAVLPSAPAEAQNNVRMQIVYGDDECTTSNGEIIVVCIRRDESERYRIPPELRDTRDLAANESWLARAQSVEYVGRSGTMSCSPVGPGGFTGCTDQLLRSARAERGALLEF